VTHATDASAKAVLRLHVRGMRRVFVREHPEADWQAGDRAGELIERLFRGRKKSGVIAVYRASGSELDPRPLSESLIELGWALALPTCEALDEAVLFRAWKPGDRLSPDVCGIAAPLASAPEVEPDAIVAPLIAFDRRGGRLGQGGGYYDRTFSELRLKARPPLFVGLGFSVQEVDRIPLEPHDERLDAILTEKEYIAVRKDL
jgi:5-formyltetrahydrofolate cyclo-ligase